MRKHHEHERMLLGTTNSKWWGGQACLFYCLLFNAPLKNVAQNLVPNPSFEEIDSCPQWPTYMGFQPDSKPRFWEKWSGSPEYFTSCLGSSDTLAGVPQNPFGTQLPHHGSAYVGGMSYGNFESEFREHIGVELTSPLEIGEVYYLSFWVSAAEGRSSPPDTPGWAQPVFWASNNVGLLFTMQPNIWTGFTGPEFEPRNYAHLFAQEVIADTSDWILVSGSFTADSAYRYLAVGNFFENAMTDTMHLTPGNSSGAFVYVDEVCVSTSPNGCDIGNGLIELHGNAPAVVFPNPALNAVTLLRNSVTAAGWKVTDLMGRCAANGTWQGGNVELDIGGWASGTYCVYLDIEYHDCVRLIVVR